ncbi:substrate-binding domain-containing protein [Amycolatopsis sp., V23-08]|uniref:Substrate-binding domain-containing protein n=1 Tax=Amycolatopsis heterodermiae TaxID=3110235 RepID=A0ABU5RG01_9PSEU|nr:substrate-binding domain-containing protein [Amycolatopsis sp., V23-08]MEA5364534.1 substrate-binding domain-containing protein [Amycolatopsis sp., V23-08]
MIAGVMLAACSSGKTEAPASQQAPANGKITLYYLQKQGDQQYFVEQAQGAQEKAKELGVELKVVNLGQDANKAITELDAAVAQGANGVAIVVPDQAIGPQVIDKAKGAGIPIIASDDIIKDGTGAPAPFVGFNGSQMGDSVGTEAGKLFKAAGWAAADTKIISAYKQDLTVCTDRVGAAKTAFAKAAGAEVPVIDVGTDNSPVDAQNRSGAVIGSNPGVKHWVVWGCNDENETGVVTALANSGVQASNIIGVGLGAYLDCKDWAAGKDTGNKSALYISGAEVGRSAIQVLVDKVKNGKALPAETIAKTTIVNKDNYKQAGVNCT